MKNKVCLVTGANSGIGKHTVFGLARRGAHVIMVCRNRERAFAAREEIYQRLAQGGAADHAQGGAADHAHGGASKNVEVPYIEVLIADLSRPQEIAGLVQTIESQYEQLHVLVNNAGAIFSKRELTPEGFEKTFATNHLSYFLLSRLLSNLLSKTALDCKEKSRIVNVASDAHFQVKAKTIDWQSEKSYSGFLSYGLSKLANVMFTYEFARKHLNSGIVVNALHPGVVATDIGTKAGGVVGLFWRLAKPFFISGEKGAETSLFLAADPESSNLNGLYFAKCKAKKSSRLSRDEAYAAELWDESERLLTEWLP